MFGSSPTNGVTYSGNPYYGVGGSVASSNGYPGGSFHGSPPPYGFSYPPQGSAYSQHGAIGYAESYPNGFQGNGSYVAAGNYTMGPPPEQLAGMQTAESMIAYPGYGYVAAGNYTMGPPPEQLAGMQ